MRSHRRIVVGAGPVTLREIDLLAQLDRLVRPGRVDVEGCLAVQPVVRAAQTQPLRANHANVIGRKALAQCAGIEFLHLVICQIGQPFIAEVIGSAGCFQPLIKFCRVGVDCHLHLVDDCSKIRMEARVQDLANIRQAEAFIGCRLGNTDPGDIPLSNMLDARGAIDEVMDLAFEHRFKVRLHRPARHLDHHAHAHVALSGNAAEIGSNHFHFTVHHFFQRRSVQIFEAAAVFTAKLNAQVGLADHFAFKRRAIRDRDRHFGHFDLDAAHFDTLLDQSFSSFEIIHSIDFVERHGNNMLVGGHTRRQDFRDHSISDDREPEVDGPGGSGIFQVIHFTERQNKGKDAFLVVQQDFLGHSGFHTTESQRRAGRETERVDGGD